MSLFAFRDAFAVTVASLAFVDRGTAGDFAIRVVARVFVVFVLWTRYVYNNFD